MADAFEVMAKSMRFRSGAHNKNVAGPDSAFEAAINEEPINQATQAERDSHETDCDDNDGAGYVFSVNEIERSGEKQPGGKAGLDAEPLFVEDARKPHRRI
jgi:hypothetical protein